MPGNSQRGGAATEYSLSSVQWRRGSGRGSAPLLDPLPTPASRGEEVGQIMIQSRVSRRQFDFEIFQRSAGLIEKAHDSLPTVLFVDDFENDDVDALLQCHFSLVCIEHQGARFAERINIHTVEVDSTLIVA